VDSRRQLCRRRRQQLDAAREVAGVDFLVVHRQDGGAAGEQQARRGAAGEPQPVHQHPLEAAVSPESVHRSFRVERESSANRIDRIQKRTMTFGSGQPESSKWWWSGAMRNTRLPPRSLYEARWMMTDSPSSTKRPPTTTRRISCLERMATLPMAAPRESEPTSPMKTSAGCELNQRKPRPAPTSAPQKTATSPTPDT